MMKLYAAMRKLRRVPIANRGRRWGQVRGEPEVCRDESRRRGASAERAAGRASARVGLIERTQSDVPEERAITNEAL